MAIPLQPPVDRPRQVRVALSGEIQRRMERVIEQWILPAPDANPVILEMFRDRNRTPGRRLVPWAGEFAGKYLTHGVEVLRLARSEKLKAHLERFVQELIGLQSPDGYLGPWPTNSELTGKDSEGGDVWDAWGHYHIMLGLLFWHGETDDEGALRCARNIGDLLCDRFLNTGQRLVDTGSSEMNLAPIHSLCLLYKLTREERYLALAREIERDFESPAAGDYLRQALAGKEFFQFPKPRWEGLHPIMGLAELYHITGETHYRQAVEAIWWSIVKTDRHNTGGFSSGEQATGDPYHRGPIETCCTIAWMALSVEMLRLTGNSIVADELELSFLNAGLGSIHPSGRWVTYDTPMDGRREASQHTLVFQARPGQPELNCCSVNGPRTFGMLSDWAVMTGTDRTLYLNYYGPGAVTATLPDGPSITLAQETDYPRSDVLSIHVGLERAGNFTLALRIPYWSTETTVEINAQRVEDVRAGEYLRLTRVWNPNDQIRVKLDFRPRFWVNPNSHAVHPTRSWEADWHVIGPVANDSSMNGVGELSGNALAEIPTSLEIDRQALAPRVVRSVGGELEFRRLFGTHDDAPSVYCYLEHDSAHDEDMRITFGADWWASWFVNGVKVFDNHDTGNIGRPDDRAQQAILPLKAGRNLIVARVTSGLHGWRLNIGTENIHAGAGITNRASVYRGPILLAYDPHFNDRDDGYDLPLLSADALACEHVVQPQGRLKPWLLLEYRSADGQRVRLCDFASAGVAGDFYRTWLPIEFSRQHDDAFSRRNPLRTIIVESSSSNPGAMPRADVAQVAHSPSLNTTLLGEERL